ncbi:MMPL family transporter [Catenuloplanes sp. NPDC051500]|uniref:MMPL family transporter n=1 Tax=Catenuloplanes sp. NPDC051500 TaxID=3363959 RepID=UPI0037B57254
MFRVLARLAGRRPWTMLLLALVFLVDAVLLGGGVADRLGNGGVDDPGAESTAAAELLDRHFAASRPNLLLLVDVPDDTDVDDPEIARQALALTTRLAFEPDIVGVTSYWQAGLTDLAARDKASALIIARIEGDETDMDRVFERIAPAYRGSTGDLEITLGGRAAVQDDVQDTIQEDLLTAEIIVLPITLIILILVFGSVIAALLPLAVGIIAIVGTNGVLGLLSRFVDVSIFAQNLTTALGLGLAIDYALLIVRRFREERATGLDSRAAVARTLGTAGRTVLFSALTVAVSLAAMLLFPMYFLRSFAYAGISVVILAAAAALIVLPALLVLLGNRLDALDVRTLFRRRGADKQRPNRWLGTARLVMRRAPVFAVGVTALLVVLGLPFFQVEFGTTDDRQLPVTSEARSVQDTMREHFDGRPAGVIDVVVTGADRDAIGEYAVRLSQLTGVSKVDSPAGPYRQGAAENAATPADDLRADGDVSHLTVTPDLTIEDISPESQDLVRAIRGVPVPAGSEVLTGGVVAALVDTQTAIGDRLIPAIALIAVTTLILVFLMTGSVLIPVQALTLNALSLTAMFGAVVWVFQDGNGAGLLGFTPTGYIETSLPVLMFCVAFGLSMDYGVFLLARMKEERERLGDDREAVAQGIARTGGVITAAAIILATVLIAIGSSRITNTKMLGLGVALAVLVDATLVRALLVPAVMSLTGRATWWAPKPLRALHRRFGLREDDAPPPPPVDETTGADQPDDLTELSRPAAG